MMAMQRESDLKVKYALSCCPGQGAMHRRRLLLSALLYLKLVGHHHWRAFVNPSLLQLDRSRCCSAAAALLLLLLLLLLLSATRAYR